MTDTLPIDPRPWPKAAAKVEGHWMQGDMHDGDRMCLVGGLESCGLAHGEWLIARAVARHRGHGESWNDQRNRTEAEVVGWLRTADPITADELADVFGPQWEPVCALILRAVTLTGDEARRLDAARVAARVAAWDAARVAVWDAVWDAVWVAAGDAVWDAARALVVRDMIGQHGFTQAHYDALTRPWATVIGPAHPDDAPVTP